MRRLWVVLLAWSCDGGEPEAFEGDAAGECTDGADNDRDGAFDCDDSDCVGSPDCDGTPVDTEDTEDAQDTEDTVPNESDDDTPVPTGTCPGDADWGPATGPVLAEDSGVPRPAGPNDIEMGLVTAWLIDVGSFDQTFGPNCRDTDDPDWQPVFDPGDILPDDPDFNYVFYKVANDCTSARGWTCTSAADFPNNCSPGDPSYAVDAHVLATEPEEVEVPISGLGIPSGCVLKATQKVVVTDEGPMGRLAYVREITTTGPCDAKLTKNDGCEITYSFDVSFAKAAAKGG